MFHLNGGKWQPWLSSNSLQTLAHLLMLICNYILHMSSLKMSFIQILSNTISPQNPMLWIEHICCLKVIIDLLDSFLDICLQAYHCIAEYHFQLKSGWKLFDYIIEWIKKIKKFPLYLPWALKYNAGNILWVWKIYLVQICEGIRILLLVLTFERTRSI